MCPFMFHHVEHLRIFLNCWNHGVFINADQSAVISQASHCAWTQIIILFEQLLVTEDVLVAQNANLDGFFFCFSRFDWIIMYRSLLFKPAIAEFNNCRFRRNLFCPWRWAIQKAIRGLRNRLQQLLGELKLSIFDQIYFINVVNSFLIYILTP